jgi:hypothetical protein
MKTWTVQCGYAAYYANTVTVEAETLDAALDQAIAQANGDPGWKSLDHCGPTFVDAVAEGDADPWIECQSALRVPAHFGERGEPPVATVTVSHGAVQEVRVANGPVRVLVRDYDTDCIAPDDPSIRTDEDDRLYILTEWETRIPPHAVAD